GISETIDASNIFVGYKYPTYISAQQTLQDINELGNLSPEAQLAAASLLQDSAFAVKNGINSARQWADAHPNITATAQTALSVAEAA
ncbi:MafB family polymorphic toxin, partial [Neisseria meningitidis]